MYQNQHGRFTAIDPLLSSGQSSNPQTFNRYVYSLNRPLTHTDPTGLQAGQWFTPRNPDGTTSPQWLKKNQTAPEGFVPVTPDSKGRLITGTANPDIVTQLNPNGPYDPPRPGLAGMGSAEIVYHNPIIMDTWISGGFREIFSDAAEARSIEHPREGYARGSEMAITPIDIGLFAPLRLGTSFSRAVASSSVESEIATVGRWMGQSEFNAMKSTNMVQQSTLGATNVAFPANPNTFAAAKPGSLYVEFGVPRTSVVPTWGGNARIATTNSIDARLAAQFGRPAPTTPPATNIFCSLCRTRVP